MAQPTDLEAIVFEKKSLVDLAFQHLETIQQHLGRIQSPDKKLETYLTDYHQVRNKKDNLRILVGVAGDTGLGKTSLLNALVGARREVLPSGNSGACTATVCLWEYNHDSHPERSMRAEITFKLRDTLLDELNDLVDELDENPDSADDPETKAYRAQLSKQMAVFEKCSGLNYADGPTASEILQAIEKKSGIYFRAENEPANRGVRTIVSSEVVGFAKLLRPYIDSAYSGKKVEPVWPLVEQVRIFMRAETLRHGLVLVDLPGEMDALEARSRIAKSFYNQLDKILIVTESIRAADNYTASQLLSRNTFLELEMDGLAQPQKMCIVVTKTDAMDWRAYCSEKEDTEDDRMAEVANIISQLDEMADEIESLQQEVSELEEVIGVIGNGNATNGHSLSADQIELLQLQNQLRQRLAARSTAEDQAVGMCVAHRNEDIKMKILEMLNDNAKTYKAKGAQARNTDIGATDIFPVSSAAFRRLFQEPLPGFRDGPSTGIPQLRKWLEQGTLEKRDAHATELLNHCQNLMDYLRGWLLDDNTLVSLRAQLGDVDPNEVHKALKPHIIKLKKRIRGTKLSLRFVMKRARAVKATGKGGKILDQLASKLPAMAKQWEKKYPHTKKKCQKSESIHFLSYGAILKRKGGFFRSPASKTDYHWLADLKLLFWKQFGTEWINTFVKGIPQLYEKLRGNFYSMMAQLFTDIQSDKKLPPLIVEAIKRSALQLKLKFSVVLSKMGKILQDVQNKAREIRNMDEKILLQKLRPIFEFAYAIKGKGQFGQRKAAIEENMAEIQNEIFPHLHNELNNLLEQMVKDQWSALIKPLDTFRTVTAPKFFKDKVETVCQTPEKDSRPAKKTFKKEERQAQAAIRPLVDTDIADWLAKARKVLEAHLDTGKNAKVKEEDPEEDDGPNPDFMEVKEEEDD